MPAIGKVREELAPGLRSFVVNQYVIFYKVIDQDILIVRALHGARDINTLFQSGDDPI